MTSLFSLIRSLFCNHCRCCYTPSINDVMSCPVGLGAWTGYPVKRVIQCCKCQKAHPEAIKAWNEWIKKYPDYKMFDNCGGRV